MCQRLPHSTMHQCLRVEEISRLVIAETINLDHPSAISLACTCRAFEAAVMEIMWGSHQTGLVDLLRCLPNEVWEIRESDSGKLYFVWMSLSPWCRPVQADSWLFVRLIGLQTMAVAFGMGTSQPICELDAEPQHLRRLDGAISVTKGMAGFERYRNSSSSSTKSAIPRMVLSHRHLPIHQPLPVPSTDLAQCPSDLQHP